MGLPVLAAGVGLAVLVGTVTAREKFQVGQTVRIAKDWKREGWYVPSVTVGTVAGFGREGERPSIVYVIHKGSKKRQPWHMDAWDVRQRKETR